MNTMPLQRAAQPVRYELRFRSLFSEGRGYAFSCDEAGRVDMDALSTRARTNYFYARTVIGREVATPAVCALPSAEATTICCRQTAESAVLTPA
jgi:hypothetical protein